MVKSSEYKYAIEMYAWCKLRERRTFRKTYYVQSFPNRKKLVLYKLLRNFVYYGILEEVKENIKRTKKEHHLLVTKVRLTDEFMDHLIKVFFPSLMYYYRKNINNHFQDIEFDEQECRIQDNDIPYIKFKQ